MKEIKELFVGLPLFAVLLWTLEGQCTDDWTGRSYLCSKKWLIFLKSSLIFMQKIISKKEGIRRYVPDLQRRD